MIERFQRQQPKNPKKSIVVLYLKKFANLLFLNLQFLSPGQDILMLLNHLTF